MNSDKFDFAKKLLNNFVYGYLFDSELPREREQGLIFRDFRCALMQGRKTFDNFGHGKCVLGRFIRSMFRSNSAISDLLTADDGVICEVQVVGPGAIEVDPTLDYFA